MNFAKLFVLLMSVSALSLSGCKQETPGDNLDKAAKNIKKAVENVKEAGEKLGEDVKKSFEE